jgi:hypothetical protein
MPLTFSPIHSVLPSKNTLISEKLFFGYETREGFNIATPEKALLDTLYLRRHVPFIGEFELDNLDIIKLMDLSKLYPMSVQKKVRVIVQHPLPLTPSRQWRGNIYQQI